MLKNMKLGTKFFLTLTLISIVPLAILSAINYFYFKAQLEKMTIGSMRAINDSRAAHINHLIRLRQEQAKELAATFLVRQLKDDGHNSPEVTSAIQDHIESVYEELKSEPRSDYEYIDQKSTIENISAWDIYGKIVANTNRELIGRKMPFNFLRILYEKGAYFKGFERDPLTGEIFLTILEGVRNWSTGGYSGVVFLKTSAGILNDITTARKGLGDTAETYIVDNEKRMITESRFIKNAVLKVKVDTVGVNACFNGGGATAVYKDYQGRVVLGVQKYLPDQQWCVLTEMEVKEAFAPILAFRKQILIIVGILIIFIIVLVRFSSRTFIKPIMSLRDASLKVAKGQYDIQIPVQANDEVGELSMAFAQMAKILDSTTSELRQTNKQLEDQKVMLEKVNQELDGFVYTASHDLRAPLRGIASFASFLEEDYRDKLDDEGKDYLQEIQQGTQRLTKLIDDLLTLSRISRIENPYEKVAMRELIDTILERIKFDIQEHNVQLEIQDGIPEIICDRIKIGEVILNLVNNAIKFSSKNNPENPRVDIRYQDDGEVHRFSVKDNGIGIDEKYHDQIFGIFKRLHTAKEYDGSGAGLSIVKRVIDDHGGRIWVDSRHGEGAEFIFTIPKNLEIKSSSAEDKTLEREKADG